VWPDKNPIFPSSTRLSTPSHGKGMTMNDHGDGPVPSQDTAGVSRRQLVQALSGSVAGGVLAWSGTGRANNALAAQNTHEATPTAHPGVRLYPGAERHTGAVDLFVIAERPAPKPADEILRIASETAFYQQGALQKNVEGSGGVEYVPREIVRNGTAVALMEGLLAYKFTISGRSPIYPALNPGTYYVWIDFIDGRWVGRVVNNGGGMNCLVLGIEVKQLANFDQVNRDLHQQPQQPRLVTHSLGVDLGSPGLGLDMEGWVEVQIGWEPFGAGCWHDIVCIPET
jgi:hypothetical protein